MIPPDHNALCFAAGIGAAATCAFMATWLLFAAYKPHCNWPALRRRDWERKRQMHDAIESELAENRQEEHHRTP